MTSLDKECRARSFQDWLSNSEKSSEPKPSPTFFSAILGVWAVHATLLQSCPTLCDPKDRILYPWDSPNKNTGVGGHALLQGIFVTQGLNWWLLHLLHCRWILYNWATREALVNCSTLQDCKMATAFPYIVFSYNWGWVVLFCFVFPWIFFLLYGTVCP